MDVGAVREQNWDDLFVEWDEKADYIPVVSTLTNVADLVLKGAINLMDQERLEEVLQSHFFKHIDHKSVVRSVVLLIPVLGNGIVYFYDRENGKVSLPEVVDPEGETVSEEVAAAILQQVAVIPPAKTQVTLYIPLVEEKKPDKVSVPAGDAPLPPRFERLPPLKPKLISARLKIRL